MALETGETDDLATVEFGVQRRSARAKDEADRLEECLTEFVGRSPAGQNLSLTGHELQNPGRFELLTIERSHTRATPEHGHSLGERDDLVHPVRDEDRCRPLPSQPAQDFEQPVTSRHVESGGCLVEYQQARVLHQRPREHAHLPGGKVKQFDRCVESWRMLEQHAEHLSGLTTFLTLVDPCAELTVRAQPDVVQHRDRIDDQDFLEHRRDAEITGDPGSAQASERAAVDLERSRVREDHAGENLDERALARTVLADHGVDLAGTHAERALLERSRLAERPVDIDGADDLGRICRNLCGILDVRGTEGGCHGHLRSRAGLPRSRLRAGRPILPSP